MTKQYALALHPRLESTLVSLRSPDEPSRPLVGYEIYAKEPSSESAAEAEPPQLLGVTDWRGMLKVGPGPDRLRVLYVKNGQRVLARLPIVPGRLPIEEARLPSDDMRLRAEAFIRGFQNQVMDLVARRELMAVRIRKFIANGEKIEARNLLSEFRQMATPSELSRALNEQRQALRTSDERLQEKIDKLFADTGRLMAKYLAPAYADRLSAELSAAGR